MLRVGRDRCVSWMQVDLLLAESQCTPSFKGNGLHVKHAHIEITSRLKQVASISRTVRTKWSIRSILIASLMVKRE